MSVGVVGLVWAQCHWSSAKFVLFFFQRSGGKEPYYDGYVWGQSRTLAIHGWPGIRDWPGNGGPFAESATGPKQIVPRTPGVFRSHNCWLGAPILRLEQTKMR